VVLSGAPHAEIIDRVTIADGLDIPWDMAWTPDGTMLVTIRDEARILRYRDGTADFLVGEGADWLKANVVNIGEGGLLGIALLPHNPNVVYLYVTRADGNAVVRMLRFGQTLGAPVDVVTGIPKNGNHNGGRIRFGPDGYLYITAGDAADRTLPQNLNSLGGKILRVVADGTEADGSPAPGNPFESLVWSYGHRNPQGIGWAPDGRMFASELGQNTYDELNLIEPGHNYGWPIKEAVVGAPSGTAPGATVDGFTYPLAWWSTADASPSGITVTDEAVYMAALRGERVWRIPLTPDGVGTPEVLLNDLGRIRLVAEGPDGFLYVLSSNGSSADKIVRVIVHEVRE
jgi:glucose/arabinose dehydrogenase